MHMCIYIYIIHIYVLYICIYIYIHTHADAKYVQLKLLVEAGMKDQGNSWRNEQLDGVRFCFPRVGAWNVPDKGILQLDFCLGDEVGAYFTCLHKHMHM
jgi:hypothetical protein